MVRTRLYNNLTGKWEYMTVIPVRLKTPWKCLWIWLRAFLRYARRRSRVFRRCPTEWDFDARTLTMRDRRAERRWVRLARREERFGKVAQAVTAMVEMQKHIG